MVAADEVGGLVGGEGVAGEGVGLGEAGAFGGEGGVGWGEEQADGVGAFDGVVGAPCFISLKMVNITELFSFLQVLLL